MTTEIGRPIVSFVEIDAALRADLDQNHSRALARSRKPPGQAAAFGLHLLCKMLAVVATCHLGACKQPLLVGEYRCPGGSLEGGSPPSATDPISIPWATGFENQFCDYTEVAGRCYLIQPASSRVVSSPVHSGQFAAAFTVLTGTSARDSPQSRCYRQGVFPAEAYYGA